MMGWDRPCYTVFVNLLLPPLLLILLHVAGLSFTTMFLVCTATVICLMEYIAWWGGGG